MVDIINILKRDNILGHRTVTKHLADKKLVIFLDMATDTNMKKKT
jgi:hypothetical protein